MRPAWAGRVRGAAPRGSFRGAGGRPLALAAKNLKSPAPSFLAPAAPPPHTHTRAHTPRESVSFSDNTHTRPRARARARMRPRRVLPPAEQYEDDSDDEASPAAHAVKVGPGAPRSPQPTQRSARKFAPLSAAFPDCASHFSARLPSPTPPRAHRSRTFPARPHLAALCTSGPSAFLPSGGRAAGRARAPTGCRAGRCPPSSRPSSGFEGAAPRPNAPGSERGRRARATARGAAGGLPGEACRHADSLANG